MATASRPRKAYDPHPSHAPSWFSTLEDTGAHGRTQRRQAVDRLWRTFMRARVLVALVLLSLQVFHLIPGTDGPAWLVAVSAVHLCATLVVWLWWPLVGQNNAYRWRWPLTIGIDL